jgi:5-amino-6-(5-phospho-D-ribitylamino)uracil phosphatase
MRAAGAGLHLLRMAPRYDMIAVDLDGTLLNSRGEVSARNLDAIRAARAAGLRVVICTGRGLVECERILQAIEQVEPVVVAGGSMTACPVARRTLHRFALDAELVPKAVERLLGHDHPVMVLKDPHHAGYDYLMVTGEKNLALDPVTVWWLESMNVTHRFCCGMHEDEHPEHTVRLGICGLSSAMAQILEDLREVFGEKAMMHHFEAVVAPEHASQLPDGEQLHILEVFDGRAHKWSAVEWLAARDGIGAERICAIGDQINDVTMIQFAGLGIAMGNAIPKIKALAQREKLSNDEDGVAVAIERVLEGLW